MEAIPAAGGLDVTTTRPRCRCPVTKRIEIATESCQRSGPDGRQHREAHGRPSRSRQTIPTPSQSCRVTGPDRCGAVAGVDLRFRELARPIRKLDHVGKLRMRDERPRGPRRPM